MLGSYKALGSPGVSTVGKSSVKLTATVWTLSVAKGTGDEGLVPRVMWEEIELSRNGAS